jgi:hypothetical protein
MLAELPKPQAPSAPPAPVYRVRATLVGNPSLAYVSGPDGVAIARVGDRLDGHRIARIDLRGVILDDGKRLSLSERRDAPARAANSRSKSDGLGRKIDALRSLISNLATSASPVASPLPNVSPSVEAIVTPGPLPTIVPNALPVGVSPTANAYGPTPFPVPEIHTYSHPGAPQ